MKAKDSTILPILTHVLGVFFSFLPALIILLATKDEHVKKHARSALNWQFSRLIYSAASLILVLVAIGIIFLLIISLLNIVFSLVASVKASNGEVYDYPFSIHFFKNPAHKNRR